MRKVVLGLTVVSVMMLAGSKLSSDPAAQGLTVAHLAAIALEGPVAKVEEVEQPGGSTSDHDALLALNEDYIRSVQTGDVARFEEILADDFRSLAGHDLSRSGGVSGPDRASRHHFESGRSRRRDPGHGRCRHRACAHNVSDARWARAIGALHRRLGARE